MRAVVAVGVNMLIVCKVGSEAVGRMLQMAGGRCMTESGMRVILVMCILPSGSQQHEVLPFWSI